jgi:hypothetical protein
MNIYGESNPPGPGVFDTEKRQADGHLDEDFGPMSQFRLEHTGTGTGHTVTLIDVGEQVGIQEGAAFMTRER